jgi:HD-like signal output (HDOD) protein
VSKYSTAGLLHDIGKFVFILREPAAYENICKEHKEKSRPLDVVEKERFGVTHAEVGGHILRAWGMDSGIVDAVLFHHTPPGQNEQSGGLREVIYRANRMARDTGGNRA